MRVASSRKKICSRVAAVEVVGPVVLAVPVQGQPDQALTRFVLETAVEVLKSN